MLLALKKILNQCSSVFFIIAFTLALLFPEAATVLKPSILYLLLILLFLGFINHTEIRIIRMEISTLSLFPHFSIRPRDLLLSHLNRNRL